LARLDASDQPLGAVALIGLYLAHDITVEVNTGAASREALLVCQTADLSLAHLMA
jgi:hypothetical protein